jgi:hypothetical protein
MHDINLSSVDAGEVVGAQEEKAGGEVVERDVDGVGIVGGVIGVPRMGNGGDLIVVVNVEGGEGGLLLRRRRIPLHERLYSRASKSVLRWAGIDVLYI